MPVGGPRTVRSRRGPCPGNRGLCSESRLPSAWNRATSSPARRTRPGTRASSAGGSCPTLPQCRSSACQEGMPPSERRARSAHGTRGCRRARCRPSVPLRRVGGVRKRGRSRGGAPWTPYAGPLNGIRTRNSWLPVGRSCMRRTGSSRSSTRTPSPIRLLRRWKGPSWTPSGTSTAWGVGSPSVRRWSDSTGRRTSPRSPIP